MDRLNNILLNKKIGYIITLQSSSNFSSLIAERFHQKYSQSAILLNHSIIKKPIEEYRIYDYTPYFTTAKVKEFLQTIINSQYHPLKQKAQDLFKRREELNAFETRITKVKEKEENLSNRIKKFEEIGNQRSVQVLNVLNDILIQIDQLKLKNNEFEEKIEELKFKNIEEFEGDTIDQKLKNKFSQISYIELQIIPIYTKFVNKIKYIVNLSDNPSRDFDNLLNEMYYDKKIHGGSSEMVPFYKFIKENLPLNLRPQIPTLQMPPLEITIYKQNPILTSKLRNKDYRNWWEEINLFFYIEVPDIKEKNGENYSKLIKDIQSDHKKSIAYAILSQIEKAKLEQRELKTQSIPSEYRKYLQSYLKIKEGINLEENIKNKTVLIIDDVLSSGSQFFSTTEILKEYNPSKIIYVAIFKRPH